MIPLNTPPHSFLIARRPVVRCKIKVDLEANALYSFQYPFLTTNTKWQTVLPVTLRESRMSVSCPPSRSLLWYSLFYDCVRVGYKRSNRS